jgi:hypothetical protein
MLGLFALTVPLYLAAYALTPADLGILSAGLVEPRAWLECAFGLFVHGALFLGGWLQLYNLADRGFSLRLLIDIAEAQAPLSREEVEARYGGGRGIAWMIGKRLDDMLESGVVARSDGALRLTPRGARAGRVLGGLRRFLGLETPR